MALALDSALSSNSVLSNSSSFADVPVFKSGGEVELPVLAISRQQTSNTSTSELVQRLQVEALFAPSSDSFRAGMNVLAQHASSMQSHTPSSLKVNEASWKALVGQLQPMNNQSAIYPSTLNTLTSGLVAPAESLTTAIDNLGSRASSTNLMVEKSLPIEAQRQMYQVVKDKVQLQVDMNTQVARIRFDPPELGRMEMVLRIEGDKLTVQMSASAATTREVLMATSERLRHELVAQNSALSEVEVALSQQHHSANPEQYFPSFSEQEHEESSGEESPSVPEYTAYIARV
ncbi:flagellar hook-length control protein FliK [Vibrio maritimus]|uniref:Flagellar hook-length control protein FliK n=1 Tax=Vibrio maritimus TaxID=990268 RepID=A0A090T3G7_9VIBR|nr:flagellar hook-length control protein FliK [Vibrio maritimus]